MNRFGFAYRRAPSTADAQFLIYLVYFAFSAGDALLHRADLSAFAAGIALGIDIEFWTVFDFIDIGISGAFELRRH